MKKTRGHLGSQEAQAPLKESERDLARQRDEDLKTVMRLPAGRRFVLSVIIDRANTFGTTFTGTSATFHAEGRRSVGVDLMQDVQRAAPDEYLVALHERIAQGKRDDLDTQRAQERAQETDE